MTSTKKSLDEHRIAQNITYIEHAIQAKKCDICKTPFQLVKVVPRVTFTPEMGGLSEYPAIQIGCHRKVVTAHLSYIILRHPSGQVNFSRFFDWLDSFQFAEPDSEEVVKEVFNLGEWLGD